MPDIILSNNDQYLYQSILHLGTTATNLSQTCHTSATYLLRYLYYPGYIQIWGMPPFKLCAKKHGRVTTQEWLFIWDLQTAFGSVKGHSPWDTPLHSLSWSLSSSSRSSGETSLVSILWSLGIWDVVSFKPPIKTISNTAKGIIQLWESPCQRVHLHNQKTATCKREIVLATENGFHLCFLIARSFHTGLPSYM